MSDLQAPRSEALMAFWRDLDDKPGPIRTRPQLSDRNGEPLRDFAVFQCPVRGALALAFLDGEGRYWVDGSWVLGGLAQLECTWMEGPDGSPSTILDYPIPDAVGPGGAVFMARVAMEMIETSGRGTFPVIGKSSGGPTRCFSTVVEGAEDAYEAYLYNRAFAIWAFDHEWGRGAFLRSAKAARARHVARLRMNRYRNNARNGVTA